MKVHPNDQVNMGQSSNDVVPTAIRVAAVSLAHEELLPSMSKMSRSLTALSKRTSSVYKSGRTHLRDAMPVTMGQEFGAYADAFDHDRRLVSGALSVRQGASHRRHGGRDRGQHEPSSSGSWSYAD